MAPLAVCAREAVRQNSACEVTVERTAHVARHCAAARLDLPHEAGQVLLDQLVKKRRLRLVAFVAARPGVRRLDDLGTSMPRHDRAGGASRVPPRNATQHRASTPSCASGAWRRHRRKAAAASVAAPRRSHPRGADHDGAPLWAPPPQLVLPLPSSAQEHLLRRAESESWSVSELSMQIKASGSSTIAIPPSPIASASAPAHSRVNRSSITALSERNLVRTTSTVLAIHTIDHTMIALSIPSVTRRRQWSSRGPHEQVVPARGLRGERRRRRAGR